MKTIFIACLYGSPRWAAILSRDSTVCAFGYPFGKLADRPPKRQTQIAAGQNHDASNVELLANPTAKTRQGKKEAKWRLR